LQTLFWQGFLQEVMRLSDMSILDYYVFKKMWKIDQPWMLSSNSFILPVPSRPAYFIHSTHGARRISWKCSRKCVQDRPTMDSVIMMLSSNSFILRKYNKSFVPQNSKTSTHQHDLTRFPLRKFLLGQTSKMTPN
jgi:hypothetical protein